MRVLTAWLRLWHGLNSRWRNIWFRRLGVDIEGYCWLRSVSIPRNWTDITLEGGCSLDDHVVLICNGVSRPRKLVIRAGTYINRFTMLDAHDHIEIGANCMIGPHCYITDGDHGRASGHLTADLPMQTQPVILSDNVWLGAGVIVLKGVRIGESAVIGAGAVVTKDVAEGAIVVGVPGKALGGMDRYSR